MTPQLNEYLLSTGTLLATLPRVGRHATFRPSKTRETPRTASRDARVGARGRSWPAGGAHEHP